MASSGSIVAAPTPAAAVPEDQLVSLDGTGYFEEEELREDDDGTTNFAIFALKLISFGTISDADIAAKWSSLPLA